MRYADERLPPPNECVTRGFSTNRPGIGEEGVPIRGRYRSGSQRAWPCVAGASLSRSRVWPIAVRIHSMVRPIVSAPAIRIDSHPGKRAAMVTLVGRYATCGADE